MEILGAFTDDAELQRNKSEAGYGRLRTYLYFDQVRQVPYARVQKR